MEVKYKDGYAYVDEYKFRRDKLTGYYLSTRNIGSSRKRLHVYMWEKHNGETPKGYEIHHKDENKDNNEIENLMCMTRKEHMRWHAENISEEQLKKARENLEIAREKASEWHKSEEGRKWHRSQSHRRFNHDARFDLTCTVCGNNYTSPKRWSTFCSRNCASKHRKDSGIDDEQRSCVICGVKFTTNKYSTVRNCSKECANKSMIKNRQKARS